MGGPEIPRANSERTLKQFVEDALNQEEIIPLVRLVFEGPAAVGGGIHIPATAGRAFSRKLSESFRARISEAGSGPAESEIEGGGPPPPPTAAIAEALIATLRQLALDRSAEILQLCRSNADDIAQSLEEVGEMRATAAEVRERLVESSSGVEEAGSHLLERLQRNADMEGVTHSIQATREAVAQASQVMEMCGTAGAHLSNQQYYKALRVLKRMEARLQQTLPPVASGLEQEGGSAAQGLQQEQTLVARLGRLGPFLQDRISELRNAVQQACMSDFNSWLVSVRAEARSVGARALWQAAYERGVEEAVASHRRSLTAALPSLPDPQAAADAVARCLAISAPGVSPDVGLDPGMHPAAAALLAVPQTCTSGDLLEGIDMALLFRCVQVQEEAGRLAEFQDYYVRNRQMQLNSDLSSGGGGSAASPDSYQAFLLQVAGNFLLEERVRRTCPSLSAGSAVEALWEATVARLKVLLGQVWEEASTPLALLTAKDFVLLFCAALGERGYQVVAFTEELHQGRLRYTELLDQQVGPQVKQCIEEDSLHVVEVSSLSGANELAFDLGLPLVLDGPAGAPAPLPPFDAPFSSMVPQLLHLSRTRVGESVAYLNGLVSPSEMVPVARQQRDRMLARIVVPALQAALEASSFGKGGGLRQAMQQVANVWSLAQALPALDDFTVARARGYAQDRLGAKARAKAGHNLANGHALGPNKAAMDGWIRTPLIATSGGAGLLNAWVALCEEAERAVVRLLAAQAGSLLGQAKAQSWLPDQPPRTASAHSAYVTSLLAYLKESLLMGAGILPCGAYTSVLRALFIYLGDEMMALLEEDAVPAFNIYAIFRFHDDLMAICQFAETCAVPDLAEGLGEPVQLCHLLVAGQVEDILDPKIRASQYSGLELKRLITILPKFREVGDKANYVGHHSVRSNSKQPQSFLKKKSVDATVKKLREILAATSKAGAGGVALNGTTQPANSRH
eukprot:jgi/Botrbrau1/11535/Bobra.0393s0014.1